jgi:hypothetical protein
MSPEYRRDEESNRLRVGDSTPMGLAYRLASGVILGAYEARDGRACWLVTVLSEERLCKAIIYIADDGLPFVGNRFSQSYLVAVELDCEKNSQGPGCGLHRQPLQKGIVFRNAVRVSGSYPMNQGIVNRLQRGVNTTRCLRYMSIKRGLQNWARRPRRTEPCHHTRRIHCFAWGVVSRAR